MTFNLSTLNARYRNLSEVEHSENAWRVIRVADPIGQAAYEAFTRCWSDKFLGESHFEELRGALGVAYRALRTVVGPAELLHSYCSEILSDLRLGLLRADNFLSAGERLTLAEAVARFEDFSTSTSFALADALAVIAEEGVHKKSLVIGDTRLAVISSELMPDIEVFPSIPRMLANVQATDRNHAVLVSAPDIRRVNMDHMRRLLLGGAFVKVTFVIPNWWPTGNLESFLSALWFGLESKTSVKIKLVGADRPSQSSQLEPSRIDWDLSIPAKPIAKEMERFSSSGPIECLLIELHEGLVMPVESGATRVSVIRRNTESGEFVLESETPSALVGKNDVVFSFAQVSERNYIREQARRLLGDSFRDIEATQNEWKTALRERATSSGIVAFERILSEAGVTKAHRLRWWINDPNFIRPMVDQDFLILLAQLGFDDRQIRDMVEAARRVNSAHDTAGRVARTLLVESLTEEIWALIQSDKAAEIVLSDAGEASFIACKVIGMRSYPVNASAAQVRRILGGK